MGVKGIRLNKEQSPLMNDVDGWINYANTHELFCANKLDIEKLVEEKNIIVEKRYLDSEISGMLKKVRDQWIIIVNSLHHTNRQRYTIAHEFAHYCLHKDLKDSFEDITFFRNNNKSSMEYEANEFAANLLMPKERVRDEIRNGVTSLKSLAEKFGVSILAMKYQVQKLGYGLEQAEE